MTPKMEIEEGTAVVKGCSKENTPGMCYRKLGQWTLAQDVAWRFGSGLSLMDQTNDAAAGLGLASTNTVRRVATA